MTAQIDPYDSFNRRLDQELEAVAAAGQSEIDPFDSFANRLADALQTHDAATPNEPESAAVGHS